jgi:hypothetical protein
LAQSFEKEGCFTRVRRVVTPKILKYNNKSLEPLAGQRFGLSKAVTLLE